MIRASSRRDFESYSAKPRSEVHTLVKGPFVLKKLNRKGNPAERESLGRGVKHLAIYESALLTDEHVAPFLRNWIAAGEEARSFDGELPLKLVLFDSKVAWVPLETAAMRHPVVSVLIRHHALGRALRLLFEYLWQESKPITFEPTRTSRQAKKRARI